MAKPLWMVRAGRGGVYADDFIGNGYVGIGWRNAGDPTAVTNKAVLVERFAKAWPESSEQSRLVGASIVYRFVREISIGDDVITYDPATRTYRMGAITGPAQWTGDDDDFRNTVRTVTWQASVLRDGLSDATRNSLGSTLTLFLVPAVAATELRNVAAAPAPTDAEPVIVPPLAIDIDPFADLADTARERIKDRIARLDWEQMQALVAALLRAMGYRTSVSSRGPDRGRDILATPDGFGFRAPRIIVEVKHRPGQTMGAPEVRALPVGRQADDRGLFVSTGGFTREAYYEAEHGKVPISLVNLDDLTREIIHNYANFDDEGRALLPLQRLYWPL
ncbi:MAG: hypothetical protein RL490_1423 [Pseudomonadota bacterium]|jgi:restriction system protein